MAETAVINGKTYDWASISASLLGRELVGISGIKYEDEVEMEFNYGKGRMPVNHGEGNYKAEGSITLHIEEIIALQKSLPAGKRLQDIAPFDITVSYINESNELVTDKLVYCKFMKNGRDVKQGDKLIETEFDLLIGQVKWNA